jgi:hypothetical protein
MIWRAMTDTKTEKQLGGTASEATRGSSLENRFEETDRQIQAGAVRARKIIQTGTSADLIKFANGFAPEEARAHRARLAGE